MSSIPFPELFVLALSRVPLFLGCRKYLLRSLYSDLQTITSGPPPGPDELPRSPLTPGHSLHSNGSLADMELDSLPLPASAGSTPSKPKFASGNAASMHSAVASNVFSLVFTESCMMFAVLMLQGIGMFSPQARLYSWKFSLLALMSIILVLVPLCISYVLAIGTRTHTSTSGRRLSSPRLLFGIIIVITYLYFFHKIPLPSALHTSSTLTSTLSRLIVLGTIILGLLSGFGAISNIWGYIPRIGFGGKKKDVVPTEEDVRVQEYSLQSVRNDLDGRRKAVERQTSAAAESSWISRVGTSLRGGDSLTQELRGLEALEYQMSQKVESMRARRAAERYNKTFQGRILNVGGYVFAVYCVTRVVSSIINVLLPSRRPSSSSEPAASTSTSDVVASLLASLLSHISHPSMENISTEDIVLFARHISLVLVGVIILTSVRRVLGGVTRALRVTSRSLGASLMLLFLAQLMGIYLLSTIVQLRNTFPPVQSDISREGTEEISANLFSTIPEFEVFGSLFDWSFLVAAGGSVFGRWGAGRISGVED